MLVASFSPYNLKKIPKKIDSNNFLLVLDLSPSVSSKISIDSYRSKVRNYYEKIKNKSEIYILDSKNLILHKINPKESLSEYLSKLDFHPWGVNLRKIINSNKINIPLNTNIVIFSDRDKNSWQDFAMNLSTQNKIWRVDLHQNINTQNSKNFYVRDISIGKSLDSDFTKLEIGLERVSGNSNDTINLVLLDKNKIIKKASISFPINVKKIKTDFDIHNSNLSEKTFQLLMVKLSSPDSVKSDNTFYFNVKRKEKKILVVSSQTGEKYVDSPLYSTIHSLKTLGNEVDLSHNLKQILNMNPLSYKYIIFFGFDSFFYQEMCEFQKINGFSRFSSILFLDLSFDRKLRNNLDNCFLESDKVEEIELENFLKKERFKSIDINSSLEIWIRTEEKNRAIVIPSESMNFSDPNQFLNVLFYYEIGKLFAPKKNIGEDHKIFRVDDISDNMEVLKLKNPIFNSSLEESSLVSLPLDVLPKEFLVQKKTKIGLFYESFYPNQYYVFICSLTILLLVSSIEVYYKIKFHKIRNLSIIFMFLFFFLAEKKSYAEISMAYVGNLDKIQYSKYVKITEFMQTITSLEFSKKISIYSKFDQSLFQNPMIIIDLKSNTVQSENQKYIDGLAKWILRGGFLIVDDMSDKGLLYKITNKLAIKGVWQNISLENELMRSFHLLKSLPVCNQKKWWEYRIENRIAILGVPFSIVDKLFSGQKKSSCIINRKMYSEEYYKQLFINILMTALTTDYKKDQIHLPEILKRLR